METHKATIKREGETTAVLVFTIDGNDFKIVLTKDDPEEIKKVFNELLKKLKEGEFNFELDDSEEDLYNEISKEYIKQLNLELITVYKELEDYELIK